MTNREFDFCPINSRIDYWQNYWQKRVRELKEAQNYGGRIKSPRFLLEDIIYDVKILGKPKEPLWSLFKEEFGLWSKNDIFKGLYGDLCTYALKNWEKPLLVSVICSEIIKKMNSGNLYYDTITRLISVLNNNLPITFKERQLIYDYTDILIAEFIHKKFTFDDITDVINHPDVTMAENSEIFSANNSIDGINKADFPTEEEYLSALTTYFKSLSVEDKVKILNLSYEKIEKPAKVLCRLEGIKGKIDLYINGIHFYTIGENTHYLPSNEEFSIETPTKGIESVNAAIPINYKSFHTAISEAKNKLNETLDMLNIRASFQYPITICEKNITIVLSPNDTIIRNLDFNQNTELLDKKQNLFTSSYIWNDATRYNSELLDYSNRFEKLANISQLTFEKLTTNAKWIISAKDSKNYCNKLLFSWFAIESLIKLPENYKETIVPKPKYGILDLIHEIMVPLVNKNVFFGQINEIINYLHRNYTLYNNRYNVPPEINEFLFTSEQVEFKSFFDKLYDIYSSVTDESFLDMFEPVIRYYDKSESGISEHKNSIKNELTYIYRLRNYIVHDAKFDDEQITYFANRALFYASSLFNALLAISTSNNLDTHDSLIKLYTDCKLFDSEIPEKLKKYALDKSIY